MTAPIDEYMAWRAEHHERMPVTDRAVLARAVYAATGEEVVAWERIVGGEVNEVLGVTLLNDARAIVRVSRQPVTRFETERWALATARDVGVPVPEMLHIEQGEDANGKYWICVENRLPGCGLDEVVAPADRERLAGMAGEIVAKLHTVPINGFGWLRPDGTSGQPSWTHVMRSEQSNASLAETERWAATFGVPDGWVRAASAELHRHDDLLASVESRLLHGDLSSNHVLTDGTSITGFIDFEQAFAGDPSFEFVRWNYFREDSPLEWLLAGYRRVADPGPDLELRIRLGRLRLHLAVCEFYGRMGHAVALRTVLRRFAEDADWFGFAA